MKMRFACTVVAVGLLAVAARAGEGPWASVLDAVAQDVPGRAVAGVAVMDVASGKLLYGARADELFNPASNAKIVTAAAALSLLGPDFRFVTQVFADAGRAVVSGPVYIRGGGDPTLATEDLYALARDLRARGIVRVTGGVVVDDGFFDREILPYGYDQKPREDAGFRAPISAASLNFNTIGIRIAPASKAPDKAVVVVDPPGYALVENDAITVGTGAYSPRIMASAAENRTRVRVWGQVPVGSAPVRYTRRVDNPPLLLGYAFAQVLEDVGISVGGDVRVDAVPQGTPLVAEHTSAPLSHVLWYTGKLSNNFVTEMVLKTIGAVVAHRGTWKDSIARVQELLHQWGLAPDAYQYRNGSGLYDANRFSPRQFCTVLRRAYRDARIRPEFLAQLATGGVDGTIGSRYRGDQVRGLVRAKTGTLDDVSALSGYVFSPDGEKVVAFSILVNRAKGYVAASRAYQERIVTAIASRIRDGK